MPKPHLRAAITFYAPPEQLTDDAIKRLNEVLGHFDDFVLYAPESASGFAHVIPGTCCVRSVTTTPQLSLPLTREP